jgi:hypothetical protein
VSIKLKIGNKKHKIITLNHTSLITAKPGKIDETIFYISYKSFFFLSRFLLLNFFLLVVVGTLCPSRFCPMVRKKCI